MHYLKSLFDKPQLEIIKLFITLGVDIDAALKNYATRTRMKTTALHWVAERGYLDLIESLIEHGENINAKDRAGRTPLATALSAEQEAVALKLKELGGV